MKAILSVRPLFAEEMPRDSDVTVLNARCHVDADAGLLAQVEVTPNFGAALALSCAVCRAPVIALATAERAELPPCPCGAALSLAAYVARPPAVAVTCFACRAHRLLPVRSRPDPTRPDAQLPAVTHDALLLSKGRD